MTPERMARLHAACFPDRPWSEAEFVQLLGQRSILAVSNAGGFAIAQHVLDEAEILTVAVDPEMRRQGYAVHLLRLLSDGLRDAQTPATRIFLEVSAENRAALALYARSGFAESGRRPNYYRREDGFRHDAVLMQAPCPLVI